MTRYLTLWLKFFKNVLIREMEYKVHFLLNILVEIGWTTVLVVSLELIFTQTTTIAGWSKSETFLIYALYRIVTGLNALFFARSLNRLAFAVNSGDLDLMLTKPINQIFLISTRYPSISGITDLILGIIILGFASSQSQIIWRPQVVMLTVLLIFLGLIIKYSIHVLITLPVFWIEKLENTESLNLALFAAARFPKEAFPLWLSTFLSFIIPVLFVAAIPAGIILGKYQPMALIATITTSIVLFFIMTRAFAGALRRYSSASS